MITQLLNKIRKKFSWPIIWHYCNISRKAKIGKNVSIGSYTEIGPDVVIGDNTRIQAQCFIPKGVQVGKNCFIGPNVTFTNDKYPPSDDLRATVLKDGVSIGANCTILPGIILYENVKIGAGSVVTKNIPDGVTAWGNPCEIRKYKEVSL